MYIIYRYNILKYISIHFHFIAAVIVPISHKLYIPSQTAKTQREVDQRAIIKLSRERELFKINK